MSDPETIDRLLQSCSYKFRTVFCPHQEHLAAITIAKWDVGGSHSTPWNVIDCPLLPAGEVWCDKSCLAQLDLDSVTP